MCLAEYIEFDDLIKPIGRQFDSSRLGIKCITQKINPSG
jgi:hypothetical protein